MQKLVQPNASLDVSVMSFSRQDNLSHRAGNLTNQLMEEQTNLQPGQMCLNVEVPLQGVKPCNGGWECQKCLKHLQQRI